MVTNGVSVCLDLLGKTLVRVGIHVGRSPESVFLAIGCRGQGAHLFDLAGLDKTLHVQAFSFAVLKAI